MAKITKSDDAPKDAVHFSFGQVEFDLKTAKASFETSDAAVIAGAVANPWLSVEQDAPTPDLAAAERDPLDPHNNPSVDHLSIYASPDAVAAAATNEAEIRKAVGIDANVSASGSSSVDNPSVADVLQATFDNVNSDATPALPEPVAAPEPTEPGGGVAPDASPQPNSDPATSAADTKGS